MKTILASQRKTTFQHTAVLVYVFDVGSSSKEFEQELKIYERCIGFLHDMSPTAKVYCLFNKSENITMAEKEKVFIF